jgi:hypothetical protein
MLELHPIRHLYNYQEYLYKSQEPQNQFGVRKESVTLSKFIALENSNILQEKYRADLISKYSINAEPEYIFLRSAEFIKEVIQMKNKDDASKEIEDTLDEIINIAQDLKDIVAGGGPPGGGGPPNNNNNGSRNRRQDNKKTWWQKIKDFCRKIYNFAAGLVKKTYNLVVKAWEKFWEGMYNLVVKAWEKFWEGIGNAVGERVASYF